MKKLLVFVAVVVIVGALIGMAAMARVAGAEELNAPECPKHPVYKGESYGSIGKELGLDYIWLSNLNGGRPLYPGDEICIGPVSSQPVATDPVRGTILSKWPSYGKAASITVLLDNGGLVSIDVIRFKGPFRLFQRIGVKYNAAGKVTDVR